MAVAFKMRFEGATLEQYDQVMELMGLASGDTSPDGAIFHWVALRTPGIGLACRRPPTRCRTLGFRGSVVGSRGVERDDEVAVFAPNRVAPHLEARVDRALARLDLEVPLVPGAAHDRERRADRERLSGSLDRRGDLAGRAERCSAVRAAIGEREELVADPKDPDAMTIRPRACGPRPERALRRAGSGPRAVASAHVAERQVVERRGIAIPDGVAPLLRQQPQRLLGLVEIPVRDSRSRTSGSPRVGGPGSPAARSDGSVRRLERLGCEADVVPDVLRRRPLAPRDLAAAALPVRVEPPEEPDERHEPAFDHRNARVREPLEDAVAEDRDEVPVHPRSAEGVVLGVEVGHSGSRDRPGDPDALEVGVNDRREPEVVARRPDRVVHRVSVRDPRRAREEDADELVPLAEPPDLGAPPPRGTGRARRARPRSRGSRSSQLLEQPVVVRGAELRREMAVREDRERGSLVRLEDAERRSRAGRDAAPAPGRARRR